MGMLGPLLTTRSTVESLSTDVPAVGFCDSTRPLVLALVRKLMVPTASPSFFSVWVATLWGTPVTAGTVTLLTRTERSRKKAMMPSATKRTTRRMTRRRLRFLRSASSWRGEHRRAVEDGQGAPVAGPIMEVVPTRGHHRGHAGIGRLDGSPVGKAQEVGPQLLGRPVTVVGVLGHRLHDDGVERRRDGRVGHPGQDGLVAHVLGGNRHRRVAGEGRLADRHLVEHDAERVDVAPGVDPLALGLLGREVGGRAHDGAGLGQALLGVDGPGDPEVGDLDLAVGGDQHVARLHVAVDHAVAVGEGQGGGHPGADAGDLTRRQRLGILEDGREGPAVDVLHDDEVRAVVLAPVEDGDDVGVGQVGGGLGLPAEPLDEGLVDGELGEEHLEGDRPIELAVDGPVDLSHAAAGDQMGDLVAP